MTVVNGQILHGTTVLTCPRDQNDTGFTVSGYLDQGARITCPCGQQFAPPPPWDPVHLLRIVSAGPRRGEQNLTYGPLPE